MEEGIDLPGFSFFSAKRSYAIKAAESSREALARSKKEGLAKGKLSASAAKKCIVEVLPGLFLGSREAESSLEVLTDRAITHILQVAYEVVPSHAASQFVYKHVPVYDMEAQDLVSTFASSLGFISDALEAGHKVLCHCLAGNSRSAATALAFMMWRQGLGLGVALAKLKALRPSINPNAGFRLQLEWFEDAGCPMPPTAWEGWDLKTFLERHNAGHRHRQERFRQQQEQHKKRVYQRRAYEQQQQQQQQQQQLQEEGMQGPLCAGAWDPCASGTAYQPLEQQGGGGGAARAASPSPSPLRPMLPRAPTSSSAPDLASPLVLHQRLGPQQPDAASTPPTQQLSATAAAAAAATGYVDPLPPSPYNSTSPATLQSPGETPAASPRVLLAGLECPRPPPSPLSHPPASPYPPASPWGARPPQGPGPMPHASCGVTQQQQQQQQQEELQQQEEQQWQEEQQGQQDGLQRQQDELQRQQQQQQKEQQRQEELQGQEELQRQQQGQGQRQGHVPWSHSEEADLGFAIITDPEFIPDPGNRELQSPMQGLSPCSSPPLEPAQSHALSPFQQQQQQQQQHAHHLGHYYKQPPQQRELQQPGALPANPAHPAAPTPAAHAMLALAPSASHPPAHHTHLPPPATLPHSHAAATPAAGSSASTVGAAPPAIHRSICTTATTAPAANTPMGAHVGPSGALTPRSSADQAAPQGLDADRFRTPDLKRRLPQQQQRGGGALRVLLGRKASLTLATPGAPASPHLDMTPNKEEEEGQRDACFPFHYTRQRTSHHLQRAGSATRPFLDHLHGPHVPQPAQPGLHAVLADSQDTAHTAGPPGLLLAPGGPMRQVLLLEPSCSSSAAPGAVAWQFAEGTQATATSHTATPSSPRPSYSVPFLLGDPHLTDSPPSTPSSPSGTPCMPFLLGDLHAHSPPPKPTPPPVHPTSGTVMPVAGAHAGSATHVGRAAHPRLTARTISASAASRSHMSMPGSLGPSPNAAASAPLWVDRHAGALQRHSLTGVGVPCDITHAPLAGSAAAAAARQLCAPCGAPDMPTPFREACSHGQLALGPAHPAHPLRAACSHSQVPLRGTHVAPPVQHAQAAGSAGVSQRPSRLLELGSSLDPWGARGLHEAVEGAVRSLTGAGPAADQQQQQQQQQPRTEEAWFGQGVGLQERQQEGSCLEQTQQQQQQQQVPHNPHPQPHTTRSTASSSGMGGPHAHTSCAPSLSAPLATLPLCVSPSPFAHLAALGAAASHPSHPCAAAAAGIYRAGSQSAAAGIPHPIPVLVVGEGEAGEQEEEAEEGGDEVGRWGGCAWRETAGIEGPPIHTASMAAEGPSHASGQHAKLAMRIGSGSSGSMGSSPSRLGSGGGGGRPEAACSDDSSCSPGSWAASGPAGPAGGAVSRLASGSGGGGGGSVHSRKPSLIETVLQTMRHSASEGMLADVSTAALRPAGSVAQLTGVEGWPLCSALQDDETATAGFEGFGGSVCAYSQPGCADGQLTRQGPSGRMALGGPNGGGGAGAGGAHECVQESWGQAVSVTRPTRHSYCGVEGVT